MQASTAFQAQRYALRPMHEWLSAKNAKAVVAAYHKPLHTIVARSSERLLSIFRLTPLLFFLVLANTTVPDVAKLFLSPFGKAAMLTLAQARAEYEALTFSTGHIQMLSIILQLKAFYA